MVNEASLLEMRDITKEFPGVKALSDVSLVVGRPEIHSICGVVIATKYLEPIIVTQENAEEVYADNEELLAAFQGAAQ